MKKNIKVSIVTNKETSKTSKRYSTYIDGVLCRCAFTVAAQERLPDNLNDGDLFEFDGAYNIGLDSNNRIVVWVK